MRGSFVLGLVLLCLCLSTSLASGQVLFSYDMVVTGQLIIKSDDVQGTAFVGSLESEGMPIFDQNEVGSGNTLSVAGAVTLGSGGTGLTMQSGNFAHQSALPNPFSLDLNNGSTSSTVPSLSISSLASQMTSTANYYNTLTGSSLSVSGNNLNINPTGTGLNVFTISASALATQNLNVAINLSNSSQAALIMVTGSSFEFGSSEHINVNAPNGDTTPDSQILWDFPTATTVTEDDSEWYGAMFAPDATLTDNNQDMMGGVYVANFTETAEVHVPTPSSLFNPPAAVPEPTSFVLFAAATVWTGLRRPRREK
jgi:choice-of-anchor A domain-containing protein